MPDLLATAAKRNTSGASGTSGESSRWKKSQQRIGPPEVSGRAIIGGGCDKVGIEPVTSDGRLHIYVQSGAPAAIQFSTRSRSSAMAAKCTHLDQVKPRQPHSRGCEECLKTGDSW